MKWNKEERVAYGKIFRLALPIIIQNLFSAAISSADVIMLNSVGQSAISAASLAVQYSSILYMVYYGLGTGATMLCAQAVLSSEKQIWMNSRWEARPRRRPTV